MTDAGFAWAWNRWEYHSRREEAFLAMMIAYLENAKRQKVRDRLVEGAD